MGGQLLNQGVHHPGAALEALEEVAAGHAHHVHGSQKKAGVDQRDYSCAGERLREQIGQKIAPAQYRCPANEQHREQIGVGGEHDARLVSIGRKPGFAARQHKRPDEARAG